ncbi:MAG TPA: hemerythrin domain-containing protein, partial [Kofleriaceae bacterium]|nr:hemerythrin domain-containing protein [Kofleriaceae bacterium]
MDRTRPRTALDQLDSSHRRHDERLDALLGAADRLAAGLGAGAELEEVQDAVAFFARSAANHFGDEDDTVFPALAAARPALAPALTALTAEHPGLLAGHARLRALVDGWADAIPDRAVATTFVAAAREVAAAYRDHAAREDALFATAAGALDAVDGDLVAAMEQRRG